jgi:hypothetical protein
MNLLKITMVAGTIAALTACASTTMESDAPMAPFGGDDSVAYAGDLWAAMNDANLAGSDAIYSNPYKGQHPHGAVLDTIEGKLEVGGHSGKIIVKRNYGGEGVSNAAVANDRAGYLKAVTVMYKREAGYDSDNRDWFWAKYLPDGTLDKNPAGMQLAGRVAKGKPKGCIACHKGAPGGDMLFLHDE